MSCPSIQDEFDKVTNGPLLGGADAVRNAFTTVLSLAIAAAPPSLSLLRRARDAGIALVRPSSGPA